MKNDSKENRKKLEDVANDNDNYLGDDKFGNDWFAKENSDGSQTWAQVRNGKIINGGLNKVPERYHPESGLSNPNKPSQK